MGTIWGDHCPEYPALSGSITTDAVVVGGGLTGLLCARRLRDEGLSCAVIEAGRLMGGVSGRTTAKVTSQHGLIYQKLLGRFGWETAKGYYTASQAALGEYRRLGGEIPCDFLPQPAILYAKDSLTPLERERRLVRSFGGSAEIQTQLSLPFPTAGGLVFPDQGQVHPVKLAKGLLEGLLIYENTRACGIEKDCVVTAAGRIHAKEIVIATHFPFLRLRGGYFLKMYQARSYVLALADAEIPKGMYRDEGEKGLSLRTCGKLLLLGGGGHRTGKPGGGFAPLMAAAKKYFPQGRAVAQWATQDCVTLDDMPYIGEYGRKHLYVATGYGKWGLTSSMVAAMVLADGILGRENPWRGIFAPDRSILRPRLAENLLDSAYHMLRPTAPRCPHLGCSLTWNQAERSWDCSCHGSRFDSRGGLLNAPANRDLRR